MALRLPPHSHCRVCEEIVPEDVEFCSEECEREQKAEDFSQRQRSITSFVVIIFVMLGVFALSFILG